MSTVSLFAYLYWDPQRELFTIPVVNHPVMLYGIFFVIGLMCAYAVVWYAFTRRALADHQELRAARKKATHCTDILCWLVVLGTVAGARLAHILFYDLPRYIAHPMEIFKIWEGGLASHGAVVGIIIAIVCSVRFLRKYFASITFLQVLDIVALSAGIAAFWIRIGNFVNQEVIGIPTTMPWGVIFGHPMDGSSVVPRHPSQLYEAAVYLAIFVFLFVFWYRKFPRLGSGMISGLLLVLVFSARFILDYWKVPQSDTLDESVIQVGQLLSIPCIILGLVLIWQGYRRRDDQSF